MKDSVWSSIQQISELTMLGSLPSGNLMISWFNKLILKWNHSCWNSMEFHLVIQHVSSHSWRVFWFVLDGTGFELRAPYLQNRHSTAWVNPSAHIALSFWRCSLTNYLPKLASNHNPLHTIFWKIPSTKIPFFFTSFFDIYPS
jgi:hypothetical protein